jgi:inosose dehydratase
MPELRWGYEINQWKPLSERILRREQQDRAFKEMSACGFRAVELMSGEGRWAPLGNPGQIVLNFGSVHNFVDFLHSCGIDQIAGFFVNSSQAASDATTHPAILEYARPFAVFLHDVGGSILIARPMQDYWREAPVTEAKIKNAAECWNKVGKMTKDLGVQTAMHIDFLCAIHSMEDIDKLLGFTDSDLVGLAIDTAELTIAGVDPVKLYEKHHARVKHFHFKDAHSVDELAEYKNANADLELLVDGGKRGIERWFWEMGMPGGLVDFPALMKSIKAHNYSGWIIVESDQSINPAESAMLNSWYVKQVLSKV